MNPKQGASIIVVKKISHGRHGHHGGAWKVAYADFVTAMMAFFLVMWIVNTSPQVKTGVASYFRDPGVFQSTSGGGLMPGASTGAPADLPPLDVPPARAAMENTASKIREELESLPALADIKDRVFIEVTKEGLRIELVDTNEKSFFGVGSAEVQPETRAILAIVADKIKDMPNKVTIEGHTDSRPYGPNGTYSNWQLSSDRANAARRVMEESSFDPHRLEALHGYGDARLRHPEDPFDARNRRVTLLIRYLPTSS
jgi:chemotaxis protein MotB